MTWGRQEIGPGGGLKLTWGRPKIGFGGVKNLASAVAIFRAPAGSLCWVGSSIHWSQVPLPFLSVPLKISSHFGGSILISCSQKMGLAVIWYWPPASHDSGQQKRKNASNTTPDSRKGIVPPSRARRRGFSPWLVFWGVEVRGEITCFQPECCEHLPPSFAAPRLHHPKILPCGELPAARRRP